MRKKIQWIYFSTQKKSKNEHKKIRESSNEILFKLNKERLRAILAYNIEDETEERAYRHKKTGIARKYKIQKKTQNGP